MIDRGFTYYVPPFMIRGNVVNGVMSFSEMENMMYKIEGEDLYLIGTSEHSMIGKFIDTITPEAELPKTLTSYSPCFRKEVGAHGIEERGVSAYISLKSRKWLWSANPRTAICGTKSSGTTPLISSARSIYRCAPLSAAPATLPI